MDEKDLSWHDKIIINDIHLTDMYNRLGLAHYEATGNIARIRFEINNRMYECKVMLIDEVANKLFHCKIDFVMFVERQKAIKEMWLQYIKFMSDEYGIKMKLSKNELDVYRVIE